MTPRMVVARRRDDVDLERDRVLVEHCQAGDKSAFDDLYLRYYSRLCRFCFRRLGDIAEAEDTAQEAFARAWKAMPTFNGERRFYPWLSVIASHLCVDVMRRSSRTTPVGAEELDLATSPVDGGQEAVVEQRHDRELLVQAMGRISPRHREVLRLREGYEWSYQQIADHQGVQVSTIETLLFRARRSLRREFLMLAEGQTGLAGFLLIMRKFVWKARVRLVPVSTKTLSSQAVPVASSSFAGASGSVVPAAAGFLATAMAAGAVAVVSSFAPHPALAAGTPAALPRYATSAITARALLPLTTAHTLVKHGAGGTAGGTASLAHGSGARPAASSGGSHLTIPALPLLPGPTKSHVGTPAGHGGASALVHGVTSTVQNLLSNPAGTLEKTASKVVGVVKSVLSGVSKVVSGVLGPQNPVSSLLNTLGGSGATGNTGQGLLGGL
jgi:RNA polymerase sigma-70 factor, ECF subfamily